jgi:hypothetical protein
MSSFPNSTGRPPAALHGRTVPHVRSRHHGQRPVRPRQPAADLARLKPLPKAGALRIHPRLTQEEFAARCPVPLGAVSKDARTRCLVDKNAPKHKFSQQIQLPSKILIPHLPNLPYTPRRLVQQERFSRRFEVGQDRRLRLAGNVTAGPGRLYPRVPRCHYGHLCRTEHCTDPELRRRECRIDDGEGSGTGAAFRTPDRVCGLATY